MNLKAREKIASSFSFINKELLIKKKSVFMKNLQSFGVQELNSKEIKDVNGGFLPLLFFAIDVVFVTSTLVSYAYHKYKKYN